jgi:hypothetical protein
MSQTEETFEFEEEMNSQVAGEAELAEKIAETKASDPDQVEVPTEEPADDAEEPVKTDTEIKPEVETTTAEKVEHGTLTGMMDEREKRQKAVAKVEELEAKLAAYETKPEDEVSIFEDEAGFKAQQDKKYQQDLRNTSLNMSQAFAEKEFGEDKVAEATKWMQDEGVKSPYIVNQFNDAKLPFHKLVELHEAEQERLNPEPARAKMKAEILKEIKAEISEEPEKPIIKSLASKRSAGEPSKHPDDPNDILGD